MSEKSVPTTYNTVGKTVENNQSKKRIRMNDFYDYTCLL